MNSTMYRLFLLLIVCSFCNLGFSQSQQQNKTLYYKPASTINGLTPVRVDFSYKVVNILGSMTLIADAKCTGDLVYQYKGREFTFTGIDEAVRKVVAHNPVIRVSVAGPNGFSKEMSLGIVSGIGGSFFGNSYSIKEAKSKEEKDANAYTVTPLQVTSVSYENGWDVQKILDEKIRNEQKAIEIKSFIESGDKAMAKQNFAEAENNYFKAKKLDNDNQFLTTQLEKIKNEKRKIDAKKNYDDLMAAAKSAEAAGDLDNAERLYAKAGGEGVNNSIAKNEALRMSSLKEKKMKETEEKIRQMKEKEDRHQQEQKDQNAKSEAEAKKGLQEKEAYNRQLAQQKTDSIAASLAYAEKVKLEDEQKRIKKILEEEERINEKAEKEKYAKDATVRRGGDEARLERLKRIMAYDPELYYNSLKSANELFDKALKINPAGELQLKREWWDNNPYIQMFADDLYEKQRRENHWNYMKKQSEAKGAVYTAKQAFIDAVAYVDYGSAKHEHLLDKIESCNDLIDDYEVSWKTDFKGENNRIKFREQAKSMAAAQIMSNDHNKAMMAYDALQQSAEQPTQYLVKKYELAARFDKAEQKYQQDMAVAGLTNSVAMSGIVNDNTSVSVIDRGMQINAFTSIGYTMIPMLMNETSDINTPQTTIQDLGVVTTSAGLDWWVYKSRPIEINIGGFGGIGLLPMKGISSFYYHYGGKLNVNFGFKRFKIANSIETLTRAGSQEIDYDVFQASNTNSSSANNRIGKGSFNYNVLRVGSGFKIDLGDKYEASHILFNVFAEKPSFYPESIFKKPIFSYALEWMSFNNLVMSISYANNYVIAGDKKYSISEGKNKSYLQFQFGKYWTIL